VSDRSYAQVIVTDCPEEQRAAARAAIYDAFGSDTLNEEPTLDQPILDKPAPLENLITWPPNPDLVLGDRYGDEECSLDQNEVIANALIAAAPGCSFAAWSDPKYEFDGAMTMYTPELGRFDGACDSNGNIHWTNEEISQFFGATPIPDRVEKALGLTWQRVLFPRDLTPVGSQLV
jgi:hypothetical protein